MADIKKLTFARIFKVDEAKKEVYGIATEEVVDSEREIFDYESSKGYFQSWSARAAEVTGGKSKGAVRYMHQLDAVGKLVSMEFDDTNKRIIVGAKIVDESVWTKIVEGVLTGFSIGGRAIKRWKDEALSAIRFTASPIEISVVDVPCCPTAVFEYFKADGSCESRCFKTQEEEDMSEFGDKLAKVAAELQALKKASGVKFRKFAGTEYPVENFSYVGNPDDPNTWLIPTGVVTGGSSTTTTTWDGEGPWVIVPTMAKAEKTPEFKAAFDEIVKSEAEKAGFSKSIGSISDMAHILQALYWVRMDAEYEALYEGEGGDPRDAAVAEKLRGLISQAIAILKDIVEEETSEMAAELKAAAVEVNMADVLKGSGSLKSHFKKSAAMYEKAADSHDKKSKFHADKAVAHKAAGESGLEEMKSLHKSAAEDHKTMADHHEEMCKMCKTHAEHLRKMEDNCTEKSEDPDVSKAGKDGEESTDKPADKPKDEEQDNEQVGGKETKAANGGQEEGAHMTEEITKAIQDAIAAAVAGLDIKKTVTDALAEQNLGKQVTDAVDAKLSALDMPKLVTDEVGKAAASLKKEVSPVFAVPRVEKGQDWQRVTSDDDCGL